MVLVLSPNGTYTRLATLEEARTLAFVAGKTVVVTTALTEAQSSILAAWPADRALKVEQGGSIANSTTFTINGTFSAGNYQAFAGNGAVIFGANSVKETYPEWFGTLAGDNSAILSAAINAGIASGIPVTLNNDYNAVARITVTIGTGKKLIINGNSHVIATTTPEDGLVYDSFYVGQSFLDITGSGDDTNSVTIRDLTITSPYWNTATSGGTVSGTRGKLIGIGLHSLSNVMLENVKVTGFSYMNIMQFYAHGSIIRNCTASYSTYAGILTASSSDVLIEGGVYNFNGGVHEATTEGYGVTFAGTSGGATHNNSCKVTNIIAFDNVGKGIDAHDCYSVQFTNNYVKGFLYNGIYAVNEGGAKIVDNIVVTGNIINGNSNSSPGGMEGIQVGSLGGSATSSESILVTNNIVLNTNNPDAIGYGILIENADTGGAGPKQVVVTGNVLQDAASTGGSAIRTNAAAIPIGSVDISNNSIYQSANAMTYGILVGECDYSTINSNKIIVTTGTVIKGIYPSSTATTTINNNIIGGGATFTTPITIFGTAYQNGYGNMVNNVPYQNFYGTGVTEDVGTAAPSAGEDYFYQGSHRKNSDSAVGQPKGWFCTVSGTPGTWVSEGNL